MNALNREVLLSFWKVHILHQAQREAVHGQWILNELRNHGYEISPGTLYPLLQRMARLGWLKSKSDPDGGRRARRDYRLTAKGRALFPVYVALMKWGNEWTGLAAPPVELLHKPCGHRPDVRVVCSECGKDIDARDTEPVVGRGLIMFRENRR